jgi:CRP/FNR family cyclic AMP-dependent transcriptional regulator
VLVIDAKRFEQMIANNREITLRLIKKLASRLESADALIEILMHKDPKARVMRALSRHAEAFGEETPDGRRVALTPAELAAQVNVEDEIVEEVLGRLKRVRVVSVEATGNLIVHDVDRLLDFLEFLEMPQKFGGDPS